MRPRLPRIAIGCSTVDDRPRVLHRGARGDQGRTGCSPTSTSPSTDSARSVGEPQEFQTRRARTRAARRSQESDREFPWPDAPQDTHQSTTDPDARLYKKGVRSRAKFAYLGHLLTENRHGLIVDTASPSAPARRERDAAICDARRIAAHDAIASPSATDKMYDTARGSPPSGDAYHTARRAGTPHRAERHRRAHDTPSPDIALSQRKRKLIEQAFG